MDITANKQFLLPAADNELAIDVERIRSALIAIDSAFAILDKAALDPKPVQDLQAAVALLKTELAKVNNDLLLAEYSANSVRIEYSAGSISRTIENINGDEKISEFVRNAAGRIIEITTRFRGSIRKQEIIYNSSGQVIEIK